MVSNARLGEGSLLVLLNSFIQRLRSVRKSVRGSVRRNVNTSVLVMI